MIDARRPEGPLRSVRILGALLFIGVVLGAQLAACTARSIHAAERSVWTALLTQMNERPLVVAHRGDSQAFPENTLPAFASAARLGSDLVELDFFESSEGVLYCMHDATLDRTTDAAQRGFANAPSNRVSLPTLAQLDAGSWKDTRFAGTRVPTLEEALTAIQPHCATMIERKDGSPEALVELLVRLGLTRDVLVQSFDWAWLERVHELAPEIVLGALGDGSLDETRIAAMRRTGATFVHWKAADLAVRDVFTLHERGWRVAVYTVDADVALLGAAALGADMITTNVPARLLDLQRAGLARKAAPGE